MSQPSRHTFIDRDVVIELNEVWLEGVSDEQVSTYINVLVRAHEQAAHLTEAELAERLTEGFAASSVPVKNPRVKRLAEQLRLGAGHDLTVITDGGRLLYGNPNEDQAHHVPDDAPGDPGGGGHRPWFS
ncbi:hypothetical protein [Kribbia dieselivorans]|uniref:hypothetical protein n=1 Tax=Kribbia dieselivorans TaxID=331526 RepID=UPI000838362B|nr:hypothetical protein [Kribbia dieselivorans]